ncbi:hypothetical protein BEI02_16405 [Elizabethkingia sp. HvH-WGS333]|uniref:RadC domain-containing protein n=5 Tax=Elizabethkingia anophelis TaxID=1117645 RepID=A0A455ZI83_9FLAO|nr:MULTISPECIES: hypothetical protein [Elizabethkingia]AIL45339.1 hypothetical protein BD94_1564 [Elizabethkingia anophelis NUHP1]MCL1641455.1 hypothetical protein [Elizabethkingia anophelis]MCL1646266.1 hypothetical protein [Elizabethkingia anophelis]OIK45911.1 hypothetical protein BEI02_16405 [Elizabethkingia sp. HvH-WGS333]DAC75932.1 TPA_exp: hypothetical protein [Elizabethkingia anophelis]
MDLFEDYELIPEELKTVCDKWQQKAMYEGLDYNDCAIFQEECEAIGYTFDYGLDADPFDLRAIDTEEQKLEKHTINNQKNMELVNDLSWYDKNITPITRAYKNFVKEMKNTSPEQWFKDGERKFSGQEKKFIAIYQFKNKAKMAHSVNTHPYSINELIGNSFQEKFRNMTAKYAVEVLNNYDDDKILQFVDNKRNTIVRIDNPSDRHNLLFDLWAKEFQNRTDLSSGLDNRKIEERMVYHYHKYERVENNFNIEVNQLIKDSPESRKSTRDLDWEENNLGFEDLFFKEDFDENLVPASGLPQGWIWREYADGSGSLISPSENSYYSYDLQTQEYRLPDGSGWRTLRDHYDHPQTLFDFRIFAEQSLKEKAAKNDLSPKLSEDEKKDLLNYRTFMKENEFILEKLQITENQRAAYAQKTEFGTTDDDYSLTKQQLDQIPDVLDGHQLSKNDKYTLVFGLLEKQEYGESYELLGNGEILKNYLNEDNLPSFKILTINDIKFNNQNSNIMETTKEFNQVQYLKDQMKYLGFGEDEKLHKDLEKGIKSKKNEFEIKSSSDKALPRNKVDFILKFNKTQSGGVFLNSYHAKLTNDKNEEMSHNFPVNRENTFTAKEAVNLLEGRSVKIEFLNPKTDQKEPAFVRFDFSEPKTEKGNYKFQNFYKNYGIDTAEIVEKSNLVFDKPEYKDSTIKSLEKGNIVKVKIKENDQVVEAKAVLNPQYKNLNLYDQDMTRINTNKPLQGMEDERGHDKANVKEQSIKR